jgi:hypothetical protein
MRVYLHLPEPNRGLLRITDALTRHAPPHVELVTDHKQADLSILFAIGRVNALMRFASECRRYAVVQVCLRSTLKPDTRDWSPLWERAAVVWSYYDLVRLALEDGLYINSAVLPRPAGILGHSTTRLVIILHGNIMTRSNVFRE